MSWDDSERISTTAVYPSPSPRSKRRPSQKKSSSVPASLSPSETIAPLAQVASEATSRIRFTSPSPHRRSRRVHALEDEEELSNRELIVDTVAGMKDLAFESVSGFKEWASSPNKSLDSNNSMDDLRKWVLNASPRLPKKDVHDKAPSSPEQAVRSLYGEQPKYETVSKSYSEDKKQSLVQDILSPFLACSSGLSAALPPPKETLSRVSRAVAKVIPNQPHDDIPILGKPLERRTESGSSLVSMDTQLEDEMYQIQRLTSWNTMATEQTYGTHVTYETLITEGTSSPSQKKTIVATTDDDGNIIPPALVEKVEQRQRHRVSRRTRRKRVVQFDYPPIRSVKECPRVDPNDLDKLFFTEEELDQFEDDRYNTRMADDVEIIAVASPLSEDDGGWSFDSSPNSVTQSNSFSKYKSTPKTRRSKKSSQASSEPPSPALTESSESSGSDKSSRKKRNQQDSSTREPPEAAFARRNSSSRSRPKSPDPRKKSPDPRKKSPRLIKGVQIYMRERSIG